MNGNKSHRKAIQRVAQWLDLEKEDEREFIDLTHDLTDTENGGFDRYDEQYLQHLEAYVFTDDSVLAFLEEANVNEDIIDQFEAESVPFDEVYRSWKEIRYPTNELLDLTMLLKLIHECSERSNSGLIDSRYKLQKIVYLVNRRLADQNRSDRDTAPYDHGKLEKTGFRYTYRKRSSGPYSRDLDEDKHRLYASNLIDEELVEDASTPEINEANVRYEISLGKSGRVMMRRFSGLLENLDTEVLSDWENTITEVVEEFGSMPVDELHEHIRGIETVAEADDRDLLILGRRVKYDSEPWLETSADTGVSNV